MKKNIKKILSTSIIIFSTLFSVQTFAYPIPKFKDGNLYTWLPQEVVAQVNTGKYSTTNCVPTSVYNLLSLNGYKNIEDVETIKTIMKNGQNLHKGVTKKEMCRYLETKNINYKTLKVDNKEDLIDELDKTPLISFVDLNENRFYNTDSQMNHTFLLIGYWKDVDNNLFLFIEDSANGGGINMWRYDDWYACYKKYRNYFGDCLFTVENNNIELKKADEDSIKYEYTFLTYLNSAQYEYRDKDIILYTFK